MSSLKLLAILIVLTITLTGCNCGNKTECTTEIVSTSPDGKVILYAYDCPWKQTVYYSAAGTKTTHSEFCGKGCIRTVDDYVQNTEVE